MRSLEIFRSHLLGSFGVAALVLSMIAAPATFAQITPQEQDPVLINNCQPRGVVLPNGSDTCTCTGSCVDGGTSFGCTPGTVTRSIQGRDVTLCACFCD